MVSNYAIDTQDLTRRYGRAKAVASLNLKVGCGHITGFLGRNGAGKSTTIRMLMGMTRPSGGTGTVLGYRIDDEKQSRELRRHVAYVGEDKQLYGYMTVEELMRFTASFYDDWRADAADRLQIQYRLPSRQKARDLSKGMKTKLALLLALARRPELLILDEPSDGLDPASIEELLGTLAAVVGDGTTVFFSSHQIAEVERIADRVCIIDRGRLAADVALDDMRQGYRRITLGFDTAPPERDFNITGVRQVRTSGRQIIVWANGNTDAVLERARCLDPVSVDVAPVSLLELFLETVKESQ